MKNFKLLLTMLTIICLVAFNAVDSSAQIVKSLPGTTANSGKVKDTLNGADTAYVNVPVDAATQSVSVYDKKVSGTVGGKWYLQGTVKSGKWESIDSLTRTNGDGQKTFTFSSVKPYASYRLVGYQSGSSPLSTYSVFTVRRTGQ